MVILPEKICVSLCGTDADLSFGLQMNQQLINIPFYHNASDSSSHHCRRLQIVSVVGNTQTPPVVSYTSR